jgi:hypothetical protein
VLAANEIDTPYTIDAGIPYYAGHTWDYYGPSIDLAFFFGNVGWWHGNEFAGGFRYDRGARVYANVNVNVNERERVNVNDNVRVNVRNAGNADNAGRTYGYRANLGADRAAPAASRNTADRSFAAQRPVDASATSAYRAPAQMNRSAPSHATAAATRGGNAGNRSDDHRH